MKGQDKGLAGEWEEKIIFKFYFILRCHHSKKSNIIFGKLNFCR